MPLDLVIYGAGGMGQETADLASAAEEAGSAASAVRGAPSKTGAERPVGWYR